MGRFAVALAALSVWIARPTAAQEDVPMLECVTTTRTTTKTTHYSDGSVTIISVSTIQTICTPI